MTETVTAAFTQPLDAEVGTIVFMPEGVHKITASVDGKAKTVEVAVDERVLSSFNEDLNQRKEKNVRPFAGFDHKVGAASFIPVEFRYEEGVGLMLDVEWTKAGREAIEGKDYSYFSPSFLMRDGVPFGLPNRGEIGSLVNDPAFEEIPRIAASNSHEISDMENLVTLGLVSPDTKEEDALVEAQTALAELKSKADESEAAYMDKKKVESEYASVEEELADLKIKYKDLMEKHSAAMADISATQEAAASAAVSAAVEAGRIAPKDEKAQEFWKKSILADPSSAAVLDSMPSNPVVEGETILAGRAEGRELSKEVPRSEFDNLNAGERLAFIQAGGTILDDAS